MKSFSDNPAAALKIHHMSQHDLPSSSCKAPPPPLISNFNLSLPASKPLAIGRKTCVNSLSKDNIPYLSKEDLYDIVFNDISMKCDILNIACTKSKLWMHPVYSYPQDGPTCGLAIICMWADSFMEHTFTLENLLKISQANYFTKQGEMFSVANMKALCEQVMGSDSVQIQHGTQGLDADKSFIIHEIKTGAVVFVPYDSDYNHDPCLKKGLKAHWALIFGLLEDDSDEVYLLARQGKSNHISIWKYSELSASNANLKQIDPKRCNHDYIIPTGGIEAGLCKQYLLLKQVK